MGAFKHLKLHPKIPKRIKAHGRYTHNKLLLLGTVIIQNICLYDKLLYMTKIDDTGCPLAFFLLFLYVAYNLWGVVYAKCMKACA